MFFRQASKLARSAPKGDIRLNNTSAGANHRAIISGTESTAGNRTLSIMLPTKKPTLAGVGRVAKQAAIPPPPTSADSKAINSQPSMLATPSRTSSLARCEKP